MTETEKTSIRNMREDGRGYAEIAGSLGLSKNTVKSFCQRNGLGSKKQDNGCLYCGKPLKQTPHKRKRKFCSSACRMRWWNTHRDEGAKTRNERICPTCGKAFTATEKRTKYCSMDCYQKGRKKDE